ncbi:MAG: hypothetical protein Q9160_006047 [Pyrenula sp. 1 TL-2023]
MGNMAGDPFFTFQNIRFSQAPNGTRRFKAPSYPSPISDNQTHQDSSYGPSCIQVDINRECTPGGFGKDIGVLPLPGGKTSEDCLFLDLYVPSSAIQNMSTSRLPVVVWFHGGAYVFGSKDIEGPEVPFYNGSGLLTTAKGLSQQLIFVTGNYRLGAFGWLAGTKMEKLGLPNAGLYDQRLLLQWVQDFIHLVGGDKTRVSAWGESAGAGSIVHHLISKKGQQDPLFSKAIIQSPAFQWQWDRAGTMNGVFKTFSELAKCPEYEMECLHNASTQSLESANQRLYEESTPCTGLYPLGPSIDGNLIQELHTSAFYSGRHWKSLNSLIVSHVADESLSFVPKFIKSAADFTKFVERFMPEDKLAPVREIIELKYPSSFWRDHKSRLGDVIRDALFTCTTRQLYDTYKNSTSTYMMQYNVFQTFGAAVHASDLIPTFYSPYMDHDYFFSEFLKIGWIKRVLVKKVFKDLSPLFQAYFVSHAITGNPNSYSLESNPVKWRNASDNGNKITNVMKVQAGARPLWHHFKGNSVDKINTNAACGFWKLIAYGMQALSEISLAETMPLSQQQAQHPLMADNDKANAIWEALRSEL